MLWFESVLVIALIAFFYGWYLHEKFKKQERLLGTIKKDLEDANIRTSFWEPPILSVSFPHFTIDIAFLHEGRERGPDRKDMLLSITFQYPLATSFWIAEKSLKNKFTSVLQGESHSFLRNELNERYLLKTKHSHQFTLWLNDDFEGLVEEWGLLLPQGPFQAKLEDGVFTLKKSGWIETETTMKHYWRVVFETAELLSKQIIR